MMTKQRFFVACFAMLTAVTAIAFTMKPALAAEKAARPNIVWLLSEDNSKHFMNLFDKNGPKTPSIERLAEHGLVYEHAFSCAPVCSVARTTLATSCYGPRIFTQFHRKEVVAPLPEGMQMFHGYLADAGYYTANNRKTDYNAITGGAAWKGNKTWRGRAADQPFFYMQSIGTTHESSLHFPASDVGKKATITDPATVFVPPVHPKTETFRYTYARYHDNIQRMDGQIGAIIAELEKDGLLEDTFIFYFGDHGGVLPGSKGYAYETGLHVPLVVRVPENWKHLVCHKPGTRVGEFVSFIDFGATVLNLAGIEVPEQMDGRPFLGKGVTEKDLATRDEAYCYADRFDEKYDFVRTVRKGNLKYMRSYQPFNFDGIQNDYRYKMAAYREWRDLYIAGKLNEAESIFFETRPAEALYDLESDPYETKNLATDPKYADKLVDLRGRLNAWVKGMPDLSFYPESYLAAEALGNPTEFGQTHKDDIAKLVDIANLSLADIDKAAAGIEAALNSDDPWQRYWGLISCSSHGKAAEKFVANAKALAADDPEPLVMARAAQFLAIVGAADPAPIMTAALAKSECQIESNLILNMVVQLADGETDCDFDFTDAKVKRDGRYVNARLNYLAPKK